jgi:Ni,Fe-hydrogenase III small subunit
MKIKIRTTKHLLQIAATPDQADAALKAGLITRFERAQLARYFKTQTKSK